MVAQDRQDVNPGGDFAKDLHFLFNCICLSVFKQKAALILHGGGMSMIILHNRSSSDLI